MDLKRNIEEFDLVFLDLETTGLNVVAGDAICEIGVYKIRQGKEVDKFQSLINPNQPIPQEAYLIHRISNEQLIGAPYFSDVADKLTAFLEDSVILAYNVKFDMEFLAYELKKINYPEITLPAIDILAMARENLKLPKYNLGAIAQFFNVDYKDKLHRAMDDAYISWKVFSNLRDILARKGVEKLADFISLYGWNNEIFKFQQARKLAVIEESNRKKAGLKLRCFSSQEGKTEVCIKSVNLSPEERDIYLWCHNLPKSSFRIRLSRVLDLSLINET